MNRKGRGGERFDKGRDKDFDKGSMGEKRMMNAKVTLDTSEL